MVNFVSNRDRLRTYQQIGANEQLLSRNGYLNLVLQSGGNLVLFGTQFGHALWLSNTAGKPVDHVIMLRRERCHMLG
jgi:hypothetical protein